MGVYEKALPPSRDWHARLAGVRAARFDHVEIALDEGEERRRRADPGDAGMLALGRAVAAEGVPVHAIVLSALRTAALGAPDARTRARGRDWLERAVGLAVRLGARIVQVPGYYSFETPAGPEGARRFEEGLAHGAEIAAGCGVMLGLENMDGEDVTSLRCALRHVEAIGSPFLGLYPDVGNLAANGHDVSDELRAGRGRIVGVHLKDARPGAFRRVPFGEGVTEFARAFRALAAIGYGGPYTVEMWNEEEPDPLATLREARRFLRQEMARGCAAEAGS